MTSWIEAVGIASVPAREPGREPARVGHPMSRWMVVWGILAICAGCKTPLGARPLVEQEDGPPAVVISHVDVFTGVEGQPMLRDQDVLLRGERIVSVQPAGAAAPDGIAVIDGRGRTLLPGFVDAHVHLGLMGDAPWAPVQAETAHTLAAHVYAGVTTVYDLGGDLAATRELAAQVEARALIGPRIFGTSAPITGPLSHPVPLGKDLVGFPLSWLVEHIVEQAADEEEARALVAKRIEAGVDYVKLTFDDMPPKSPHMADQVLAAAIAATHAAKKKAVVHTTAAADIVRAAALGADLIAHGPYRDAISVEQAQQIAAHPVPIVMTLTGFAALADAATTGFQPHPMVRETTPPSLLDPVVGPAGKALEAYPTMKALADAAATGRPTWPESIRNLVAAGVPIWVGTDSALPGTYPGGSYHAELALLAELGVPLDVLLLGATSRPARFLSPDPAFGVIAAGKIADLVLVRGDPTAEVAALSAIERVWVRGQSIRRIVPGGAGQAGAP